MNKIFKKYLFLFLIILITSLLIIFYPQKRDKIITFTSKNILNFIFILTPIFILIGLMDIYIEKEMIIKIIGTNSGVLGSMISFFFGIITAVPLYALLPIAGILLKKGSKLSNVLIFICSSASIRIPLLLFEISSLGFKFTLIRFSLNLVSVFFIALTIDKILTIKDKNKIYKNSREIIK